MTCLFIKNHDLEDPEQSWEASQGTEEYFLIGSQRLYLVHDSNAANDYANGENQEMNRSTLPENPARSDRFMERPYPMAIPSRGRIVRTVLLTLLL